MPKKISEAQEKETFIQRKVLFSWSAPMRSFKKLDKKRYWTIAAAVLALFVVLAILGQFGLMAAIAAVMFLVYVLGTVPPEDIKHVITTLGVETVEKNYDWKDLRDYWFSVKDDVGILNIDTNVTFPSRLIMLINKGDQSKLHIILKEKLPYKDVRDQSSLSKISEGEWVNLLDEKSAK